MTRYRKTMAQAMNEGAIQMQIAALKKAYEPMRNKRISLDNANKLSQIFNRFDANKEMMKQLYKADIPFVSAMASSRLISKHNMKAQELMQIRKEGIETATEELQQINEIFLGEGVGHISGFRNDKEKANMISLAKQHGLKVDDSGSKLKLSGNMRKILDMQLAAQKNGLKAEEVRISLDEGKMKTIATMFDQGKSAEEIAKKMKLPVDTVKSILGKEEKIYEFKKMTVTIQDMDKRKKAIADLMKQNLGVSVTGGVIKVDGKGRDLNNIAKDLMNFYSANVRAESYTIDESADEDFYNPVTEACWVGYKQVGMKNKGGKQVPNCVPESVNEQDDSMTMAKDMKKKKEELPKKDDVAPEADTEKKEGDNVEKLKKDIEKKDDEIAMLKTKAETEKAKVAKKETEKMVNPETGEPLLQVGVAYKHLRDKMKKEKVSEELNKDDEKVIKKVKDMLKGASDKHAAQAKMIDKALKNEMAKDKAYAIGMATAKKKYNDEPPLEKKTIKKGHEIADKLLGKKENAPATADIDRLKKMGMKPKKENVEHPAKEVYESIAAVRKKADKSGMPYSILKKVYDRGMAAWRGGHRPGATQVQWALARVNSFVTKSSGTWGGADKDLAKQVRGSK